MPSSVVTSSRSCGIGDAVYAYDGDGEQALVFFAFVWCSGMAWLSALAVIHGCQNEAFWK